MGVAVIFGSKFSYSSMKTSLKIIRRLRHATSPAGINFLDLLNLIPIIIVKRKDENNDIFTFLESHVIQ